jgi:sec-independent protein translocase protein TatA
MFGLGMMELVIVLVIGLFLFGKRLPNFARTTGKAIVDFKKEVRGLEEELTVPAK